MNINDIDEYIEVPQTNREIWTEIFVKQMSLAQKYKEIEGMGNLLDTIDNNINTAKGQKWIKDFAWRVTEELAEAYEAYYQIEKSEVEKREQLELHFKEELADALHFMVELTIIAGYANLKPSALGDIKVEPWDVVYKLGLLCNTLKNKPWKQTQMLTDRANFEQYLNESWTALYTLLLQKIGSDKEIYMFYFKKNKVNQFRQRSNY